MSKFKSIDVYLQSNDKIYQILPLKFERLHNSVFVSNLVGEFLIISNEEFEDFVHHRLSQNSSTYNDLHSKHFLINNPNSVALELLALKLRTKLSRLSNFTALHMFVVSLRCEHSCPYCQVSRQSDDKIAYDMTEEVAEKALELTFKSPSP